MNVRANDTGLTGQAIGRVVLLAISVVATLVHASVLAADSAQQLSSVVQQSTHLMPEEHRASTRKVVVLPGTAPATGAVTGSYQKETLGLLDGMDEGRDFGTINQEVAGIPINFPIRILTVPGAIIGGLIGASTREVQDYRDAMTENLTEAAKTTLSNDALATDVFWRLHATPSIDAKVFALTTPIPQETEALLYVSFSDFTIDVQKDDAVLSMAASATLRRISDGVILYENQVHYQDKDTLKNWIENDSAAWMKMTARRGKTSRTMRATTWGGNSRPRLSKERTFSPSYCHRSRNRWLWSRKTNGRASAKRALQRSRGNMPWHQTIRRSGGRHRSAGQTLPTSWRYTTSNSWFMPPGRSRKRSLHSTLNLTAEPTDGRSGRPILWTETSAMVSG